MISGKFGDDIMSKPINVNRSNLEEFWLRLFNFRHAHPGEGLLPGCRPDCDGESWEEFFTQIRKCRFLR